MIPFLLDKTRLDTSRTTREASFVRAEGIDVHSKRPRGCGWSGARALPHREQDTGSERIVRWVLRQHAHGAEARSISARACSGVSVLMLRCDQVCDHGMSLAGNLLRQLGMSHRPPSDHEERGLRTMNGKSCKATWVPGRNGPSSNVSTTSPSLRRLFRLNCAPNRGPPIVSTSTTTDAPIASGSQPGIGCAQTTSRAPKVAMRDGGDHYNRPAHCRPPKPLQRP